MTRVPEPMSTEPPGGRDRSSVERQRTRFVMVEPRSPGNAGAAARAIKNLGFRRLVLVQPGFELDDPAARMLAVDAGDVLAASTIVADLDAALDGAQAVVGTTARAGKHRRPHWRLDAFAGELARLASAGELALVFGREDRGLTDDELDRCTHLVHLPASAEYASFNLAQAVLLAGYELRRALLAPPPPVLAEPAADHASREALYAHLERALRAVGFLYEDSAVPMMRRLRRMLGRVELTATEVRILRGVARQVLWAANQARRGDAPRIEPPAEAPPRPGDERDDASR